MKKTYRKYIVDYANSKGVICPYCESKETYYIIENKFYRCKSCKADIRLNKDGKETK